MADGKRKLFCKTTNERIASAINNLEKKYDHLTKYSILSFPVRVRVTKKSIRTLQTSFRHFIPTLVVDENGRSKGKRFTFCHRIFFLLKIDNIFNKHSFFTFHLVNERLEGVNVIY